MLRIPFKYIECGDDYLMTTDSGNISIVNENTLLRFINDSLNSNEIDFFLENGFLYEKLNDIYHRSFLTNFHERHRISDDLNYIILVPTLRCDLSCHYCQVSRAPEHARGFDWDVGTLEGVKQMIAALRTRHLKLEFQGGEPSLRADAIEEIADFCRPRFESLDIVICSNLSRISETMLRLLERPEVSVSTSLDGPPELHDRQRTGDARLYQGFIENLEFVIRRFGIEKVSPIPTVDFVRFPDPVPLIDSYRHFGFDSIHLRPVVPHGFARKTAAADAYGVETWNAYYARAIDYIFDIGLETGNLFYEFYYRLVLNKIFRVDANQYVDLRSPNIYGKDYLVIDFDGKIYPSDESRMITRVGAFDLSCGNIKDGIDNRILKSLNHFSINDIHEECVHCAYQPFCGVDVIDDLARYERVDIPRRESWFCRRNMFVFDMVFRHLTSRDSRVEHVLSRWLLGTEGSVADLVATLP